MERIADTRIIAEMKALSSGSAEYPQLSLCLIARDSSRTLPAALESIRPWVDEMVVVDTGSIDETPSIAAQFGARVFHFPWCDDFAAARNESLRHASGHWLFWMDSDDTIDIANGQKLRNLGRSEPNSSPLAYVMQVHCPGPKTDGFPDLTVVDHVKLFQNHPELRFEGRIHEQILPSIRRIGGEVAWSDVFVVHSGSDNSDEGRRRKQQRDLRLLELDLRDRPNHPFVLFNLGMTYADMGANEDAITAIERCLTVSTPGESHVRKAYALLASSLEQSGRVDESRKLCQTGLQSFPEDAELNFRAGMIAHRLGMLDESVAAYRKALANVDERHFCSRDPAISGHKARHNLAVVYAEQGRHDLAELCWREVIDEMPQYRAAWRNLGESLLTQRKLCTVGVEADRLDKLMHVPGEASFLRFKVANACHQPNAIRELEQAAKDLPDDLDVLRAKCQFLFEQGENNQAEKGLLELRRRVPHDGALHHNLGALYARSGRLAEAAQFFEQSLSLRPRNRATEQQLRAVRNQLSNREHRAADVS